MGGTVDGWHCWREVATAWVSALIYILLVWILGNGKQGKTKRVIYGYQYYLWHIVLICLLATSLYWGSSLHSMGLHGWHRICILNHVTRPHIGQACCKLAISVEPRLKGVIKVRSPCWLCYNYCEYRYLYKLILSIAGIIDLHTIGRGFHCNIEIFLYDFSILFTLHMSGVIAIFEYPELNRIATLLIIV